jgi:hypothetical protein
MFSGTDARLDVGVLDALICALADWDQDVDAAVRIDRIAALERVKAAIAAAQARETAAFVAERVQAQRAEGVPAGRLGQGAAAEVGLARRLSPYQAARYTGWATILTSELPNTFAALQAGRVAEWRALIVAKETIWLSRQHRLEVDAELAARYAALHHTASTQHATGDPRGRGQVMPDTIVERLTGHTRGRPRTGAGGDPARHDRPDPARHRPRTRPTHRLRTDPGPDRPRARAHRARATLDPPPLHQQGPPRRHGKPPAPSTPTT